MGIQHSEMKCNLCNRLLPLVAFAVIISIANAADPVADAEQKSFLPLIAESTFTYNFVFKDRKGTESLVVKSTTRAGVELFYFIRESEANDPLALIGATSFGRGAYVKREDGIATLDCYDKSALNSVNPKNTTLLLKSSPET